MNMYLKVCFEQVSKTLRTAEGPPKLIDTNGNLAAAFVIVLNVVRMEQITKETSKHPCRLSFLTKVILC